MGFFRKTKKTFDPLVVAQELLRSVVLRPHDELRGNLTIPSAAQSNYQAKVHFYRLASTITALLTQEENYPRVSEVRESLETLIFGKPYHELVLDGRAADDQEERMAFLNQFQMAMRSFATLVSPKNERGEIRWAREWLIGVDVDAHNPISCFLFSSKWMIYHNAVLEIVRKVAEEYKL